MADVSDKHCSKTEPKPLLHSASCSPYASKHVTLIDFEQSNDSKYFNNFVCGGSQHAVPRYQVSMKMPPFAIMNDLIFGPLLSLSQSGPIDTNSSHS